MARLVALLFHAGLLAWVAGGVGFLAWVAGGAPHHAVPTETPKKEPPKVPPKGPRPRIYVYEDLDPKWRTSREAWQWQWSSLYGLEMIFPLLLGNSTYVTKDPEEADYFYVFIWAYYSEFRPLPHDVIDGMKRLGPWWDRNQGRDHVWILGHDQGVCDNHMYRNLLRHSIVIEHWGKPTGVYHDNPCNIFSKWAAESCDQVFNMVDAINAAQRGQHMPWPCYIEGKDIVVPSPVSEKEETSMYTNLTGFAHITKRDTLMMFGGGINVTHMTDALRPENDAGYSWGTRQTLARLYDHDPRFKIFYKMVPNYWEEAHKAIFCFAPAGWGWGARVKSAITRGCIPVIVQDGIKVEWEDQLPFFDFAIRMPSWMIHRMPEILEKYVADGRVPAMQKNLACVWRLFWWQRPHGRAFELTMCELKARALGQKLRLDLQACRLFCGDDKAVDFNAAVNSV